VLRFGERRSGARAYLAFDGGIDVPLTMGSRATHVGTSTAGWSGRPVAAGDRLPLGRAGAGLASGVASEPFRDPWRLERLRRHSQPAMGSAPISSRAEPLPRSAGVRQPGPVTGATLRVLPGPQLEFFEDEALDVLQRTRFTVSSQSNRMGYRLRGDATVPRVPDLEMISDATFAGAVQVPASGDPILLLADRQTTGGYPQIATVISADLPLAAQLAPGDWVQFTVCTRAEAIAALVAQEGKLLALGG
jgi:antagonist of KipI